MRMISCLHCKKEFNAAGFTVHIKYLQPNFMSSQQIKANNKYFQNPKICPQCNTIVSYEKRNEKNRRFCSRSCSATFSNLRRVKKTRKCISCEKILTKNQKKYCSNQCQQSFEYITYIEKWLKREIEGGIKYGYVSHHVRRYLISLHGEQCWQCEWKEVHPVTGNIPIHVDHIDGNCRNNEPNNLRLLCPNCHSLTPTFGALNKKGRGIGTMRKA